MSKLKKQPKDMTTEELAKAVFHPKVHKKLKEICQDVECKTGTKSSSQKES